MEEIKSPHKSIEERTQMAFQINIQRNAYPRGPVKRYPFSTLKKLMDDAPEILGLPAAVKKIFNEQGQKVTSEEMFKHNNLYFFSCGEGFEHGINVAKKNKKPKPVVPEEEKATFYENAIQQNKEKEAKKKAEEEKLALQSMEKKKIQERRERETASFNRLIALSGKTVQETFIESTLSAFASTEPDKKAKLQKFEQLSTMTKNTQYYNFINQLVTMQLAPTFGSTELQDEVDMFFIDMLKGLTLDEMSFIITGLPQTGKSTVLYSLATILFRKIQQSSANDTFLFLPLNPEKLTLELGSIKQLYNIMITTTMTSARYANYAIAPFIPELCQWFCSITTQPVLPSFPQVPSHVHGIDFKAIQQLGHKLFENLKDKEGMDKFLKTITKFPLDFAKAIGLKGVFFIIDHFEYFDVEFYDEQMFPDSLKPVRLAPLICSAISKQKYIVSCQTENLFSQAFTCEGATPIDTEGIISQFTDERVLTVKPMNFTISLKDCNGCPGIISAFEKTADLAENVNKEPQQNKKVKIQSAVQRSRYIILKKQLMHLLKCLAATENDNFTLERLNSIDDTKITVTVEGQKNSQKEEQNENDTITENKAPASLPSPKKAEEKTIDPKQAPASLQVKSPSPIKSAGSSPSKLVENPSPKQSPINPQPQKSPDTVNKTKPVRNITPKKEKPAPLKHKSSVVIDDNDDDDSD